MNESETQPKPKPKTESSGSGSGGKKRPAAIGSGGGGEGKKKRKSGSGHEDKPERRVHISQALTAKELGHLLGVAMIDVITYAFNEMNVMIVGSQAIEVDVAKKIAIGMGFKVSDSPINAKLKDSSTKNLPTTNLYKLLQVDPKAESGLIRQAYRYLAEKYHPDNKITGDAEMFRAITDAWKLLSDYAKRAIYDESLIVEDD